MKLTAAQAIVRYLAALRGETPDGVQPLFGGVFAIFGHGNVAGMGEALYQHRAELPTYRAHNEQGMAHAAIAYAKANFRRRMMACTTSIGPGATNLVTAAALAHVNRLPVLFLPGDIFVSRAPDPVLQQVEDFGDGTVSANDCLRPVSRYFDRIVHPAQLLSALPQAVRVLTDAALCGPVTLALPQDVQAMAYDYPDDFFAPPVVTFERARRPSTRSRSGEAPARCEAPADRRGRRRALRPCDGALRAFADAHAIPWRKRRPAKARCRGTIFMQRRDRRHRLADGQRARSRSGRRARGRHAPVRLHDGLALAVRPGQARQSQRQRVRRAQVARRRARRRCEGRASSADALLEGWTSDASWADRARRGATAWRDDVARLTSQRDVALPYDGDVIGAVQRSSGDSTTGDIVVCAAGTLPAELHKLWRTSVAGGYHMEYGYSCMGYEIAGGLGVKMARPDREVVVMVGDGSYLMMNSEIATSVMLGRKLVVVILDNRGYGCINRLQQAVGGVPFNNLLDDCVQAAPGAPRSTSRARGVDGRAAENVKTIPELEAALARARAAERTYVICIDTDPAHTTSEGGWWWEVAVPEVSSARKCARRARQYEEGKKNQS
jgi:3D-(3,5/4)-trihydroxycyclohexane-1,2-dione acylhydrolase (decyclizing)